MTLQQLRFVVSLEETGSITKTAASLYLSQPNLSTALKALEEELGITIFIRSSRGVEATAEGAEFLHYAKSILAQVDKMEFVFKNSQKATSLVIACIRSSYMTRLFCDFYNLIPKDIAIQLSFYETTTDGVFDAIINSRADVGKLSFVETDYQQIHARAAKNRIEIEPMWKVRPYILVSAKSPLARAEKLTQDMLEGYTQAVYGDFTRDELRVEAPFPKSTPRTVSVMERGTMMDVLSNCHDCYMWTNSTHPDILRMYELKAIPCDSSTNIIEAMVYRKNQPRSKEAQWFVETCRALQLSEYFLNQEPFNPETVV